jgi:hypothetical protein
MQPTWNIRYSGWLIADGGPEIDVEQDFDWFALEFWPTGAALAKTSERDKSAVPISDFRYRVTAEVVFFSEKSSVIDFGLRAIAHSDNVSPDCKQGDFVTGELALNLPLCTAIVPEEISKTLSRKWHVNEIHADTTPYISRPDNPKFFFRDESQVHFALVSSTRAAKAHDYVLHCTKLA